MTITITPLGKNLIVYGMVLFLLGLIQGALIPYFLNPRMALSAHLAAVQSGMAMAIVGLIWSLLTLKPSSMKLAYYSNITGLYAVWIAINLGAMVGASRALPIAGEGFSATAGVEIAIEAIVTLGAVLTIVSFGLIVFGLMRDKTH